MSHENNSQAIATRQTSPAKNLDRVSELMRTLAPVRPVGMNDDMASDWAAVIIADTRQMTDRQFAAGCANARRTCNDHRGVLKAIFGGAEASEPYARSDRFLNEWNKGLASFRDGYPALEHSGSGRIGDIAKRVISQ